MQRAIARRRMRFILTLFFATALVARADESLSGRWEGQVRIPDKELTLIVDIASSEIGSWAGSVIIPGFSVKGAALSDIAVKDSDVSFAIKSGQFEATCQGHLNADGMLAGDFKQAGNTAPFTLRKTGPAEVELPAKSTAVMKELEGEWNGEYEMFGYPRKVTFKLANRAHEGATAEFVIVGKKVNNLPVDLVTNEGEMLTIDSHATGISYEGRFNKSANEIKGTFIQGPIELPLVLRKGPASQ